MILKIKATPKAIETVNAIIAQGLRTIEENPLLAKHFDCNKQTAKEVEVFRKALVDGYLKESKKKTKPQTKK